jgi:hypothetical protein
MEEQAAMQRAAMRRRMSIILAVNVSIHRPGVGSG